MSDTISSCTISSYHLSGHFIEACDCTVICPCWVDDDPEGGHCTGLVAWTMAAGSTIDDQDVAGCTVVSVSTHGGSRRRSDSTTTVLYVDDPGLAGEDADKRFTLLSEAFSGRYAGPLEQLANVSGTVADCQRARVTVEQDGSGPKGPWSVTIRPMPTPPAEGQASEEPDVVLVHADGEPQVFDEGHNSDPLVLQHTALSYELGGGDSKQAVQAQRGGRLVVNVGALPGGSLDVVNRSGMRGTFSYEQSATAAG